MTGEVPLSSLGLGRTGPTRVTVGSEVLDDVLGVVVDGMRTFGGWGAAMVALRRGAGGLTVAAMATDDGDTDGLVGTVIPDADLNVDGVRRGDERVSVQFLPAGAWLNGEIAPVLRVPDLPEDPGDPTLWHRDDMVVVCAWGDDGTPEVVFSVDEPRSGRRPTETDLEILRVYGEQASLAVAHARRREELARAVVVAESTREAVYRATTEPTFSGAVEAASRALVEGFRLSGVWVHVTGEATDLVYGVRVPEEVRAALVPTIDLHAKRAWQRGTVLVDQLQDLIGDPDLVDTPVPGVVRDHYGADPSGASMIVPLSVPGECVGWMLFLAEDAGDSWSAPEIEAAVDIGADLGQVLGNTRFDERRHELLRELRELDSYKSDLVATVAHELKTPLTAIAGNAEILLDELEGPGPLVTKGLETITRAATRMRRAIDDLLLLAKVSDPASERPRAEVDAWQTVRQAVEVLTPTAARAGVALEAEADGSGLVVLGSHGELLRLWTDLVGNAVKFSDAGDEVCVRISRRDGDIAVTVTDTGLGIAPEDVDELFTEFFRSTNIEAARRPGTGLGLVIARHIVERHRGRIDVESTLGEGTTFTVLLPAAP